MFVHDVRLSLQFLLLLEFSRQYLERGRFADPIDADETKDLTRSRPGPYMLLRLVLLRQG